VLVILVVAGLGIAWWATRDASPGGDLAQPDGQTDTAVPAAPATGLETPATPGELAPPEVPGDMSAAGGKPAQDAPAERAVGMTGTQQADAKRERLQILLDVLREKKEEAGIMVMKQGRAVEAPVGTPPPEGTMHVYRVHRGTRWRSDITREEFPELYVMQEEIDALTAEVGEIPQKP
jgi:hypothetical protein